MNIFDKLAKMLDVKVLMEIAESTMKETTAELADIQTDQMSVGETNTGDLIEPEYRSNTYANYKKNVKRSKAPKYTPDLNLTGDFYSGVVAKYNNKSALLTSTDAKTSKLKSKYKNIFGLNEKFQSKYNKEVFLPVYIDNLRKRWKL